MSPKRYNKLYADILENGMKHPIICAWDDPTRSFRIIIGNNRVAMLAEMGRTHARALLLGPAKSGMWPAGYHELMPFDGNLHARLLELWEGHDFRSAKAYPWTALVELCNLT